MRSALPIVILLAWAGAGSVHADEGDELRFARIIGNDMVLQQGKPIVTWGWAKPGATVEVTLTQDAEVGEKASVESSPPPDRRQARNGEGYSVTVRYVETNPPRLATRTVKAKAGDDGRWTARFDPAKASFQPTWIIARSGGSIVMVKNILVGEIWVCAGQSNMGWGGFNRKDREAGSADFPGLRYVAWHDSYYKPLDDVRPNIRWTECSPETAEKFSAVPYLFGMFLHRYLKVPVGIINVARGGTLGQTWCLRSELDTLGNEIMRTVLADYDAQTAAWNDPDLFKQIMADWEKACEEARLKHKEKAALAKAEGKAEPRLRLPRKPGDPRSGWSPPAFTPITWPNTIHRRYTAWRPRKTCSWRLCPSVRRP